MNSLDNNRQYEQELHWKETFNPLSNLNFHKQRTERAQREQNAASWERWYRGADTGSDEREEC